MAVTGGSLLPPSADFLPPSPGFGMGVGTGGLKEGGERGECGLGLSSDSLGHLLVLLLTSYVLVGQPDANFLCSLCFGFSP